MLSASIAKFSKTSRDVATESVEQLRKNSELLDRCRMISFQLRDRPHREYCLLCREALASAPGFVHRDIAYAWCSSCGHIQTRALPPDGYPRHAKEGLAFSEVYPCLDEAAYESRRTRIYSPKVDWIFEALRALSWSDDRIRRSRWIELGCGAGYFINALQRAGVKNVLGLEHDPHLAEIAREHCGAECIKEHRTSLERGLQQYPGEIFAAFFVIEHLDDLHAFLKSVSYLPVGTVFAFSIPLYGLATVLESAFSEHWARQLDNVVHTQLFSHESLAFSLQLAECRPVAHWIFGQDILDLRRMLAGKLQSTYDSILQERVLKQLTEMTDSMQEAVDRMCFADSVHVVSVRK